MDNLYYICIVFIKTRLKSIELGFQYEIQLWKGCV